MDAIMGYLHSCQQVMFLGAYYCLPYKQGQSYSKACPPTPPFLKNYFILCISIKKFKNLATKIEVPPPPPMFELVQ